MLDTETNGGSASADAYRAYVVEMAAELDTYDDAAAAAAALAARAPELSEGECEAIIKAAARRNERAQAASASERGGEPPPRAKPRRTFAARPASGIRAVSIEWLWQSFLPLGALSLLYGVEGDGKSTLTMMLAAMATRGDLPGALDGQPATVEIVAYEDDPAAVLVPRLLAAGADLERVFIHGGDAGDEMLTLPDDVAAFGRAVGARDSKLVIIDPLPDALREGLKDNNNGDVRKAIVPLNRMAQETGAAVLGVTHPNKGATDAANKVMGSKAWRSVPRSVLLYGRDPDDLNGPTRVVAVSKANYAGKPARKVKIESVQVEGVEGSQPLAVLGGESSYTDTDIILANVGASRPADAAGRGGQSASAERLLYRLLEDGGGQIEAKDAFAAGDAAGLSKSTVQRARADIGATGGRIWTLPTGLKL